MHGVFLGTGAAEQVPSIWCRCERCQEVRQLDQRNRRRNACFFLEPDTLIDMPPELPTQAWEAGLHLSRVKHLVFTHAHGDHLYPNWLKWRQGPPASQSGFPVDDKLRRSVLAPRFGELNPLTIYGSAHVLDIIQHVLGGDLESRLITLQQVEAHQPFYIGESQWLPFPANHPVPGDTPFNYIIQGKAATWLYGLDSGGFDEDTWSLLERFQFDVVILEATGGDADPEALPYHLNLVQVREIVDRFREMQLLKPDGRIYLSHLDIHHWPPHEKLAPQLAKEGLTVAFDGMVI